MARRRRGPAPRQSPHVCEPWTEMSEHSQADDSPSSHPPIRTYKPRRGRITRRQARGLQPHADCLLAPDGVLDLEAMFHARPVILEIGFGTGAATAKMAAQQPDLGFLAVDVHTPGVGDLVSCIQEQGLQNIRVIAGDAMQVLQQHLQTGSLHGVRSFFPDPWPKARHHKRRLVQPANVRLIADRVRKHGSWDLATDWLPYAEHISDVLGSSPNWAGGCVARPDWRPVTKYEALGIERSREIADFHYLRTDNSDAQ